jgi:hypothetical protein
MRFIDRIKSKPGYKLLLILALYLLISNIEYRDSVRLAKTPLHPVTREEVRELTKVVNPRIYQASRIEAAR